MSCPARTGPRARTLAWVVAVWLALGARGALAAGFALLEQSARALGWAYAGEAAVAADASTIFYNPAGLTLLDGTQFVSSGFVVIAQAQFHDEGSRLSATGGGGPLGGPKGSDGSPLGLIPAFFFSHAIGDRWRLGLGVTVPYGLVTDYDDDWVGRYHALGSSLETVNVNPTVAYRVFPWLSLAAGAMVEYAKARLSNRLDLGGICRVFGAEQGVSPAVCDALGLRPGAVDGYVKVSGDDWATGWTLGMMLMPSEHTRVGISYRSAIAHTLRGQARFVIPPAGRPLQRVSGALVDTGGTAAAELPERAALGVFHRLTPAWAVAADVAWTNWTRFEELRFVFDNPRQPAIVQPEGWEDSVRVALGVEWTPSPPLQLRLGSAWDKTPVPSRALRTPRIPDTDRVWLAVGAGVRVTSRLRADLGYAHLFATGGSGVRNPDPVTGNVLRGDYAAAADIVGMQLTWDVAWPPWDVGLGDE